jgi:hypothetical protein
MDLWAVDCRMHRGEGYGNSLTSGVVFALMKHVPNGPRGGVPV